MNDSGEVQDVEIDLQWKIIPCSQSAGNCSKFLWDAELRSKSEYMEFAWCIGKRFFDSLHAVINSSSTPYQGTFDSWNQSATGGNPVRDNTGIPVA